MGGMANGGRGGTTGVGGMGGMANGGRGGTTGAGGIGGMANGGRGGITATGVGGAIGIGGIGGAATGGRGGGAAGTGVTGGRRDDVRAWRVPGTGDGRSRKAIDNSKAPGFDAPGFRCKSLTVCPPSGACIYYATTMFGSLQSAEDTYTDGAKLTAPMAVRVVIDGGAASQCGNPIVTFGADEYLTLTFDGGEGAGLPSDVHGRPRSPSMSPAMGRRSPTAALTMPARLRPGN